MLLKVLAVFVFVGLALSSKDCDLPPSLWCSTPETANRCKVFDQCREFSVIKQKATPVNITLYHESLCPDCLNFIKTSLWTAFTKVSDIFTITLVPYGNAMEKEDPLTKKYKFYCQHGEGECQGNLIETCADYYIKDWKAAFNFTHCIVVNLRRPSDRTPDVSEAAKKCAQQQNVNYDQIDSCAQGSLGNSLEHQMAVRTRALNPPHQYVPWVTLNGVHTEDIQKKAEDDLVKLVCDTYQGEKPSACQETQRQRTCLKGKQLI